VQVSIIGTGQVTVLVVAVGDLFVAIYPCFGFDSVDVVVAIVDFSSIFVDCRCLIID
jgi:hypothetical protein